MKITIETEGYNVFSEFSEGANAGEVIESFTSLLTGVGYHLESVMYGCEDEAERLRKLLKIEEDNG